MGVLNFLKNVFKKEEVVVNAENSENIIKDKHYYDICEICKGEIENERYIWIAGKIAHKKCFKRMKKEIINGRGI